MTDEHQDKKQKVEEETKPQYRAVFFKQTDELVLIPETVYALTDVMRLPDESLYARLELTHQDECMWFTRQTQWKVTGKPLPVVDFPTLDQITALEVNNDVPKSEPAEEAAATQKEENEEKE